MANSSNNENAEALANSVVSSFKKPMVSLHVELDKFCGMKAIINGIPVTPRSFHRGGPGGVYIPVNQYLKPEGNTVSLQAWTKIKNFPADYQSSCSVTLVVWDFGRIKAMSDNAIVLGKMTLSMVAADQIKQKQKRLILGQQNSDVVSRVLSGELDTKALRGVEIDEVSQLEYKVINKKGGEAWVIERQFDAGFKIEPSKWQSSKIIKDNARTKKSVMKMYQSLWNYHKNHDLKGWTRINFEKDSEVARMTYNPLIDLQTAPEFDAMVSGEDKSWELQPLDLETAQMRIVANGQLVTLLTDNVGAVIHYDSKIDDNFKNNVPIYLRREGKGWVISR